MKGKLRCILFFLSIISCADLKGQEATKEIVGEVKLYAEYYTQCNKALEFVVNEEYNHAISLYETIFSLYYPFPEDLNNLKNCYLAIGNNGMALETSRRMVLSGYKFFEPSYLVSEKPAIAGYSMDLLINDSTIYSIIRTEYDSLRQIYLLQVDFERDKYLSVFASLDRFVGNMRSDKLKGKITDLAFSNVASLFMDFLKSEKIPRRFESDSYNDLFGLALVHISLSLGDEAKEKEFFTEIWQLVLDGGIHPLQYAILYDQVYVRIHGNHNSFYGTYISSKFDIENGGEIIFEIAEPSQITDVDKRREELFLPPLSVWASYKGYKLPNNYKK